VFSFKKIDEKSKTQRRAQRGTKYHAAPAKTAESAPNTVRPPLGMIIFVCHGIYTFADKTSQMIKHNISEQNTINPKRKFFNNLLAVKGHLYQKKIGD
jgi:hypothetical protein